MEVIKGETNGKMKPVEASSAGAKHSDSWWLFISFVSIFETSEAPCIFVVVLKCEVCNPVAACYSVVLILWVAG